MTIPGVSVEEDAEADINTAREDRAEHEADRAGGQGLSEEEAEARQGYHRCGQSAGPAVAGDCTSQAAAETLAQAEADLQHDELTLRHPGLAAEAGPGDQRTEEPDGGHRGRGEDGPH